MSDIYETNPEEVETPDPLMDTDPKIGFEQDPKAIVLPDGVGEDGNGS